MSETKGFLFWTCFAVAVLCASCAITVSILGARISVVEKSESRAIRSIDPLPGKLSATTARKASEGEATRGEATAPKPPLPPRKAEEKKTPPCPSGAIASIFRQANPRVSARTSLEYAKLVVKAAEEFGVSPFLIGGILVTESTVRANATSSAGAVGLMQIHWPSHRRTLPKRIPSIRTREDLMNPENNIRAGALILADLHSRHSTLSGVLRGYLGSDGPQYRRRVLLWKNRAKEAYSKGIRT